MSVTGCALIKVENLVEETAADNDKSIFSNGTFNNDKVQKNGIFFPKLPASFRYMAE